MRVTFVSNPLCDKVNIVPVIHLYNETNHTQRVKPVFCEEVRIVNELFRIGPLPTHNHHPIVSHLEKNCKRFEILRGLNSQWW